MGAHPVRRYLISFGVAALLGVGVCALRGVFAGPETEQMLSALCDAAFAPGALIFGMGVIVFVADDGFFDIISYGVLRATHVMDWRHLKGEGPRDFYEYKQLKHAGKKRASYSCMLITGAVCMLVSLFILLLYETY